MKSHEEYRQAITFWGKIYTFTIFIVNVYLWWQFYCFLGKFRFILPIGNALLGAAILEWAWYNTKRVHNVNEERDSMFPAFRRIEAKHWNKWMHYPIAMTLVLPKFWFVFWMLPGSAIFGKFILFGYTQRPIVGWRKNWIDVHNRSCNYFYHIALSLYVTKIDLDDYDYTEWLGPGYKEKQELPNKIATHIGAPHACWLDDSLMQYFENHAFCVKAEA